MIWLAVFPTLTVLNLVLGDWLRDLSPVVRTFVLATVAVPIVIYGLMPRLHKAPRPALGEPHCAGRRACVLGSADIAPTAQEGSCGGRPLGGDQALPPAAPRRRRGTPPADRTAGPRAQSQAHPGLRTSRLREDDAARQVAHRDRRPAAAGRVALPGGERQPARAVLDLPGHRRATGGTRGRGRRLGAAADAPAVPRQRPGHPHQRAEHAAHRAGPGPRRLPPRRQPGPATERDLPARAPSAPGAPGHQHPRRPGAAAGPAARPGRPGRDPCRRPAFHAGRGRGLPQRHRRARAHRQPTSQHSRRAPKAGSPPCSWRRSHCGGGPTPPHSSPPSPATTATSWTTWPRRCSAASRRRSATSCSRPPSSTG